MTDQTERRRTFLALSPALASTAFSALAQVAGAPSAEASGSRQTFNRSNSEMSKHAVSVPKDNAIYGTSSSAFEKYGYSPATRVGGLLFIAGVVGARPDGSIPESVAEQSELAFRRTAEILRLEGLTMVDLVEVVSYHVGIAKNFEAFVPAKERYFAQPFPTWTIIGVEALARPMLKIEIRSIAALRT
jgi:enamine deaminase RidA (YjgF/YER057c/UK114 family)